MRTFTTKYEVLRQAEKKEYPLNCLSCTIYNKGESQILFNDKVVIEPGKSHPINSIQDFNLMGELNIQVSSITGDYTNKTVALIEYYLETTVV